MTVATPTMPVTSARTTLRRAALWAVGVLAVVLALQAAPYILARLPDSNAIQSVARAFHDRPWLQGGMLALATLVSEDLACVAAGELARQGVIGWTTGIVGCFVGIFVGDLALWGSGRAIGWFAGASPWARRKFLDGVFTKFRPAADNHLAWTMVVARCIPGARLPVYLAAGAVGASFRTFAIVSALAAGVWTPILVLVAGGVGGVVQHSPRHILLPALLCVGVLLVGVILLARVLPMAFTHAGRRSLWLKLDRARRYEFWPMIVFYAPVIVWIACKSIRRGWPLSGFASITAANPAIPLGGLIGESKSDILKQLPLEVVVPYFVVEAADTPEQLEAVETGLASRCWSFPVICKPDVGERGTGVALVRDRASLQTYLTDHRARLIVQQYHAGPFEAGIFYYRYPDEAAGKILSITDKQFPIITGDGVSTLEELIYSHPRFRLQAETFLSQQHDRRSDVMRAGETTSLTIAGNHCRGTLFKDGANLVTPELEAAIDATAHQFSGFYFGRFDVRYSDSARLRSGQGFHVIELNGISSESTNLYDPEWSLWCAQRMLFRQWNILFRIADQTRRRGATPATPYEIWRAVRKPR